MPINLRFLHPPDYFHTCSNQQHPTSLAQCYQRNFPDSQDWPFNSQAWALYPRVVVLLALPAAAQTAPITAQDSHHVTTWSCNCVLGTPPDRSLTHEDTCSVVCHNSKRLRVTTERSRQNADDTFTWPSGHVLLASRVGGGHCLLPCFTAWAGPSTSQALRLPTFLLGH